MQDSKRDTDVKNSLLDSVGEGEGGMIWENSIETCILSYVKWITSPGLMHGTGCPGLVHWDDPERWDGEGGGRKVQDGGDICVPMADSCWCMVETNTTFKKLFFNFNWRLITLQYCGGFGHTLTWINHGCTYVSHREPPCLLPPHPISLGHPSAPALSTLSHASSLDWQSISHMIIYMFQCYSVKSSHPRLLPQNPKDCSLHLYLSCCLAYRVIVTIFLNSIYMR